MAEVVRGKAPAQKLSVEQHAAHLLEELRPKEVSAANFIEQVATEYIRAKNRSAIDRALKRGVLIRKTMEEDEGGARSSEQVAKFLGLTRQAIDQRRKARKLIAWQDQAGHWRFPVWQFDSNGLPFRELPAILEELPGDPWSDMIFFLTDDQTLGGRPLDILRRGKGNRVRLAAMRFGRQGA
jgi:hypothetical protein